MYELCILLTHISISGEPSFEALKKLLSGDNVNIQEAVEELQRLVNELVDSGLTASLEFSNVNINL